AQVEVPGIRAHQVGIAVVVVVGKSGASGPAAVAHPRLLGDIGESAVTIVSVKNVAAQAGDVKVGPAVVVVVAYCAAHGEGAGRGHAGVIADISESAVAIVVVQRSARRLALERSVKPGGI